MKFWKNNLMVRLVGYFLILSLTTTGLVAYITYIRARSALTQSLFEQLTAVASLKENNLLRWTDTQRRDVLLIAQLLETETPALQLLALDAQKTPVDAPSYQAAYSEVTNFLQIVHGDKTPFAEILILSGTGGKIIASTQKSHEGQYRVLDSYFVQGKTGPFVQQVYPSPVTGKP
ncbi:MAG: adenylate/guanylate cyclase domain-containing protein, partial [Anaerolineae bacterium]